MNRNDSARADTPGRLGVHSPPSILLVGPAPDLRSFLRASLERWYQVAETASGTEAVQHLEHCPPQALIVGPIDAEEEEALATALQDKEGPPVLKLWSSEPPAGWVDATLRHPFMRVDLLRAVDRLIHSQVSGDAKASPSDAAGRDVEITAGAKRPMS